MYNFFKCVAIGIVRKLGNHTPVKMEVILVEFLWFLRSSRNAHKVLDILVATLVILVVLLLSNSDTVCAGLIVRI